MHACTDTGRVRPHNEDTFLVADLESGAPVSFQGGAHVATVPPHGLLLLVADGMGGAASGELASSMGSAFLLEAVLAQWTPVPPAVDTFVEVLRDATVDANQRLHRYAVAHPEHRGMGTTLTAAGVLDDQLYLVQVGDSRGYLVRDGVARQLTKDQSLIQRLVELGELTAEQAEASTRRNIILQALGPEAQVVVDLTHQPLRDGDLLLLCSDGLSGLVPPDELAALAAAHEDEAALCEALVAQANARGGHDNITVVVARFHGEGLGPAQPGDAVGYAVYPLAGTLNDGSVPTALSPALGAQLRADPTPRFGTPVPSPEVIAQARAAQAAVREAPTVAGGVAAIREPVATVAADTARLEERRARALPIQVALGLLGAAALLWALANLLQR
ncbi:MAG: hypothetical protein RLZ32_355 [Gemmatimonadota bacterium]|jgi:protein phosphatase